VKLTLYTEYSFRALIYLGLRPRELVTIQEVSERFDISKNHLMKVVQGLAHLGYVETVRGKHGGIRLRRPAREIRIGEVVRRMEADFEVAECFGANNACAIAGCCTLAVALNDALAAFFGVLDGFTLEDLLKPRRELRHALHL
jgi:Rrf2 family transcriptional regulator, nitric oxide-sensitive transcriptional repressor